MFTWTQVYDPLGHWWLSTPVLPRCIIVLLGLLAASSAATLVCHRRGHDGRSLRDICILECLLGWPWPAFCTQRVRLAENRLDRDCASFSTTSPLKPASLKS